MADPSTYRPAPGTSRSRRASTVPRRHRPGHLRRQGEEPAAAAELLLRRPRARCTRGPGRWSPSAASVEWTVVSTEVEALQLEYNWIKEFDPRFNVRYRDDKSYPSLAVTLDEEYPRLQVMRGPNEGRPVLRAVRARLGDPRDARPAAAGVPGPDLLRRGVQAAGQIGRPCLLGYIGKCSRAVRRPGRRPSEHRQIVEDFCDFMAGRTDAHDPPAGAADGRGQRRSGVRAGGPAARRPGALRRAMEKQAVVLGRRHRRRRGRVRRPTSCPPRCRCSTSAAAGSAASAAGSSTRPTDLRSEDGRADVGELVEQFLLQFYGAGATPIVPREVLVPVLPDGRTRRSPSWLGRDRGAAGCRCGCRSAATSGADADRRSATPSRRSPSTSCAGPAT